MSVCLYMKHRLPLEIIDHTLTYVVNYDMQLLPFDEKNEVRTKNETKLSSFSSLTHVDTPSSCYFWHTNCWARNVAGKKRDRRHYHILWTFSVLSSTGNQNPGGLKIKSYEMRRAHSKFFFQFAQ